jgi:hypothetical protein
MARSRFLSAHSNGSCVFDAIAVAVEIVCGRAIKLGQGLIIRLNVSVAAPRQAEAQPPGCRAGRAWEEALDLLRQMVGYWRKAFLPS